MTNNFARRNNWLGGDMTADAVNSDVQNLRTILGKIDRGEIAFTNPTFAGATFTGAVLIADGTVAAPSLAFASDTGTGLYKYTTHGWSLTSNGVDKFYYDGSTELVANTILHAIGIFKAATGSGAAPTLVFASHTTTGWWDNSGDPTLSIAGTAKLGYNGSTVYPSTNSGYDLGTTLLRYGNGFIDTLTLTNPLTRLNGGTGLQSFLMKTGTYTGNGTSQNITHGLVNTPDMVVVADNTASSNIPELFITGMGTSSHDFNGVRQTNAITAVGSTTFSVGANNAVNQNTVTYSWMVFKAQ